MGNKVNKKGRNLNGESYVMFYRWFLDCPAWLSLNPVARSLYLEIKRRFHGNNNGGISFSHRQAAKALNCSNKPVMKAFKDLEQRGFIKVTQKGAFKGVPFATTWLLTELPKDHPIKSLVATKDFMSWKAEPVGATKKSRYAGGTLPVCPEHTERQAPV